ncbi:spore coat associated protein CotJA [Paenibacillus silviterrae]|uniref:spore coat associated protein CotJA n=1 Tax=Paenibacillus silviterrae TaxID=3242194 RepID=UPI0025439E59|nr:spore coat associated protein CotJA [Paenibacillus chinjuensis]
MNQQNQQVKVWFPFVSPNDPCPPIECKTFVTPPNLYIPFQPPGLPQYSPIEALRRGTLWPALFSPYEPKRNES